MISILAESSRFVGWGRALIVYKLLGLSAFEIFLILRTWTGSRNIFLWPMYLYWTYHN